MQWTPSRRFDSSKITACLAALMIVAIVAPAVAEANAALRLYPDVADGGGGQLVTHTPFVLTIANDGSGGGDNTAYEVELFVAVNDPSLLTSVTLTFPDTSTLDITESDLTVGLPEYPCTGRTMPPHGVYPAAFVSVPLGDILQGESVELGVEYTGSEGLSVHFDAAGWGLKNNGDCRDVSNPFGHDVTAMIPGGDPDPPACDVDVDKTSDVDQVEIDDEAVFTITVDNHGDCELTMAVLTDFIPLVTNADGDEVPAFSVLATDPPATSITDTEVVWELGTIAADSVVPVSMTVVFDEPAADGHEVVNAACLSADELDEDVCDNTTVTVGDVTPPEPIGSPGYWCRQIRAALEDHHNARYTVDELQTWLDEINDLSAVFHELRDTTTVDLVRTLLCRPNTLRTAADRLMRHLMALWFNVVAERVDPAVTLGDLCLGDEGLPDGADPTWTVEYVLGQAEDALVNGADDETLLFWKDVIDYVNNCGEPGSCERIRRHLRNGGRLRP